MSVHSIWMTVISCVSMIWDHITVNVTLDTLETMIHHLVLVSIRMYVGYCLTSNFYNYYCKHYRHIYIVQQTLKVI